MASLVGQCISAWAHVEIQMAILLGLMLDANTEAVLAVYETFRNARARRDALNAAAKVRFRKQEEISYFGNLLKRHKSLEDQRNDVVHGLWGVCEDLTDGLVWIESKHVAIFGVKDWNAGIKGNLERFKALDINAFYYLPKDIQSLNKDVNDFYWHLVKLLSYLSGDPKFGPADAIFLELCSEFQNPQG